MRDPYSLSRQSTEQSVDQTLVDAFRDIRRRKKTKKTGTKTDYDPKPLKRNGWDKIDQSSSSGYHHLYERKDSEDNNEQEAGSSFDPIQAQRSKRSVHSTTTTKSTQGHSASERYKPVGRSRSASNNTCASNIQSSSSKYNNDWSGEALTAPSFSNRVNSSADAILSCRTRSLPQSRSRSRLDQEFNNGAVTHPEKIGQDTEGSPPPVNEQKGNIPPRRDSDNNNNTTQGFYDLLRQNVNQFVDWNIQQDYQEYERRYYNEWGGKIDKSLGQGLDEALKDLKRRKEARKASNARVGGKPPMKPRANSDDGSTKQCEYISRAPWRAGGQEYRYQYVQRRSPVCEGVELEKDRSGNIFIFDSKSKSNALYEIIENEDGSISLMPSSIQPDQLVESESFSSGRPCDEILARSNDGESVSVLSLSTYMAESMSLSGLQSAAMDQPSSHKSRGKKQISVGTDEVVEDDNTSSTSDHNVDRYAPAPFPFTKSSSRSFRQIKKKLCALKCFKDQPEDHDDAY